jgi:hypothetical protein
MLRTICPTHQNSGAVTDMSSQLHSRFLKNVCLKSWRTFASELFYRGVNRYMAR